jgi:hypothetical protein
MRRGIVVVVALAVTACSEQSSAPSEVYDATRARRVLQPPPGEIRAVPPHAVRVDGIGPYLLGAPVSDVLNLVGPRKVLLQISGVVDYSVVRAESDTLLVGGTRGRRVEEVSFVSAIRGDTAKTEGGITIGATADELRTAMGPLLRADNHALDPRILAFARIPNARFVVDANKLIAITVLNRPGPAPTESFIDAGADPGEGDPAPDERAEARSCDAKGKLEAHAKAIVSASRLKSASVAYGCFASGNPEALAYTGDQIVVVGGDPGKLRRIASYNAPRGLAFAAPLDADGDGRHEVVLVSHTVGNEERSTRLELLRVDSGRFVRAASSDVYRISESAAAANGAKLSEIELLLDVEARGGRIVITGLYVHSVSKRPRTVAPLVETRVSVRRSRASEKPDESSRDAGVSDAAPKAVTPVDPAKGDKKKDGKSGGNEP